MGMRQPTGAAFAVTDSKSEHAERGVIDMIGHWGVFRGGWSVLVFAYDRKRLVHKVRCQSRERAAELGQDVQAHGLTPLALV